MMNRILVIDDDNDINILLKKFLTKGGGAFSVRAARENPEVPQSEVAREHRHDVEKTGLRIGVAEVPDPFDVSRSKIHRDKISAVTSFWSMTRRRPVASCA